MDELQQKTFCELKETTENSREYAAWKTVYTKTGGHVEDEVTYEFIDNDGKGRTGEYPLLCVTANGRDQWVYLSPFQIAYLLELFTTTEKDFVNKVLEQMKK